MYAFAISLWPCSINVDSTISCISSTLGAFVDENPCIASFSNTPFANSSAKPRSP